MQVNDVIWMVMRRDDRVQAGSRGRPRSASQPRQGPVTEVQRDAQPVVLEQESAARSTRFGPGTASLGSVGGGGQNTALQGSGGQFSGVHGADGVGTVGTAKHAASQSSERETSDIRRHAPILVVAPFRCQGIPRRCRRAICQAQWRGDRVSAVKNPR